MTVAAAGNDRHLARYVRRFVYPYSAHYQPLLDAAGVGARVRGIGDLARIPPTDLRTIGDAGALVLRPDVRTIVRRGARPFAARTAVAKAAGGMHGFNRRVVERDFKPIHWVVCHGVPIGYSQRDLLRLAALGAQWLQRAGVEREDVLLSLLPAGPSVAHWQLVSGCRRMKVSAIHLDPAADPDWAERVAPSVIVGEPDQLAETLDRARRAGHALANLRTILAVGEPLSSAGRSQLHALGRGAAVVGAWCAPGVRAVWTECREGVVGSAPTGYHAWDDDVLEVADGELLWTSVGWRGSAVLRLRTFTDARIEAGRCGACGRGVARIVPLAPAIAEPVAVAYAEPEAAPVPVGAEEARVPVPVPVSVEALLDAESDVADWQIERRTFRGADELIVFLAPAHGAAVVPLVRRLDRVAGATQFVVLPADAVAARVATAGRVIDARTADAPAGAGRPESVLTEPTLTGAGTGAGG